MGLKFTAYIYKKYNIGRTGHLKALPLLQKIRIVAEQKAKI